MAPMPDESVFTKIIRGPSHRVYEDEYVYAFLDINPVAPGHTLVVPKEPAPTMGELSDGAASALGRALPRICRAVCGATGVDQYNLLQNNGERAHQAVFHVHFHVIPKPDEASGLGVGWPTTPIDHGAAATLAADITARLEGDA